MVGNGSSVASTPAISRWAQTCSSATNVPMNAAPVLAPAPVLPPLMTSAMSDLMSSK